jgi:transposase-like protein
MSKQSMREEAERLIRETMARKAIVVKQGNTRIEATCGKCGAPNRVSAERGASRVKFACKQCGHKPGDALTAPRPCLARTRWLHPGCGSQF